MSDIEKIALNELLKATAEMAERLETIERILFQLQERLFSDESSGT